MNVRYWKLQFYFYRYRRGLSHRLRLRLQAATDEERAWIRACEEACIEKATLVGQFGVYQRLLFFPCYLYRPDIHSVLLDGEFFYGIPTSTCFLSLGHFILVETTHFPRIICPTIH